MKSWVAVYFIHERDVWSIIWALCWALQVELGLNQFGSYQYPSHENGPCPQGLRLVLELGKTGMEVSLAK